MSKCNICVHYPVCELWRKNECQDAFCYAGDLDGNCKLYAQQWIPVTEGLPEIGVPVLVTYRNAIDGTPRGDGVAAMEARNIINEAVLGKYCVVRGESFGVFAGIVEAVENDRALLKEARRLWYWEGAASPSQLAMEGVKRPADCKFTVPVSSIVLNGVIEIILATERAEEIIRGVREWKIVK